MKLFGYLLALAMMVMVAEDIFNGVWGIHSGAFFPFRHLDFIPLYPPSGLILEWLLTLAAAGLIAAGRTRPGAWVGFAVTFIALTQRFSNHRSLLLIVLFFLLFETAKEDSPTRTLIRVQLVLVYTFSALNKITAGFLTGVSLSNLFAAHHGLLPRSIVDAMAATPMVQVISWAVVAGEILVPFLLLSRPRIGFTIQIALHAAFTLVLPGLASFGFLMLAMGCLFLPKPPEAR